MPHDAEEEEEEDLDLESLFDSLPRVNHGGPGRDVEFRFPAGSGGGREDGVVGGTHVPVVVSLAKSSTEHRRQGSSCLLDPASSRPRTPPSASHRLAGEKARGRRRLLATTVGGV